MISGIASRRQCAKTCSVPSDLESGRNHAEGGARHRTGAAQRAATSLAEVASESPRPAIAAPPLSVRTELRRLLARILVQDYLDARDGERRASDLAQPC